MTPITSYIEWVEWNFTSQSPREAASQTPEDRGWLITEARVPSKGPALPAAAGMQDLLC